MQKILALALLFTAPLFAQSQNSSDTSLLLFMPETNGAINLSPGIEWKLGKLFLYDEGTRLVMQLTGSQPGIEISYVLFPSRNSNSTAQSCREEVVPPLLSRFAGSIVSKSIQRGDMTTDEGKHIATASYTLFMPSSLLAAVSTKPRQSNLFGFYGEGDLCAEVHVSSTGSKSPMSLPPDAPLKAFTVLPDYKPTLFDRALLGAIFYQKMHDYAAAALYYGHAFTLLPAVPNAQQIKFFRYLTDQTSMSYGMSGNLKKSRAVLEAAIAKDPDYPLYYYNLACADAESGDAQSAQQHLQQAFDRRANTLPGEKLPDPASDDSIQKLKKNKPFWDFVQALPKP